jgi:hypothetical protein
VHCASSCKISAQTKSHRESYSRNRLTGKKIVVFRPVFNQPGRRNYLQKRINSAVLCVYTLQLNWFQQENQFSCTVWEHITAELVLSGLFVQYCTFSFVLSDFSLQLSAFSRQLSAFSLHLSAFSLQPSAFSLQPIMFWGLSGFKIRGFKRRGFTTTTEIGFLCRMIGFLWTTAKAAYWGGVPPPKNTSLYPI